MRATFDEVLEQKGFYQVSRTAGLSSHIELVLVLDIIDGRHAKPFSVVLHQIKDCFQLGLTYSEIFTGVKKNQSGWPCQKFTFT